MSIITFRVRMNSASANSVNKSLLGQFLGEEQMKSLTLIRSLTALALLVSASAYSDSIEYKPQLVRLIPQDTFIPPGFDDNDVSQIVLSGNLPNTCYRAATPTYQVDTVQKKIIIQNYAYLYPGCWCNQVLVPYTHTLNLGILPKGEYQVLLQDHKDVLQPKGTLSITVGRTPSPDEFEYAPVQDVFLEDPTNSTPDPTLIIRGRFESDCMYLQEIKVLYRATHIVEVLPIAMTKTEPGCNPMKVPFESRIRLHTQWRGSTLIYVRSLNGQSITKVVDL